MVEQVQEIRRKQRKKLALMGAEQMYKDNSQPRIEDFVFPYGKLDPENDWVRLAALLIQQRLKCSGQWLVKHIGENPCLQYFIGMKEYGPCPFGASTLVTLRKRFSEKDLAAILEASVPKAEAEEKDDSDDGNEPPNSGTLVLDATCCHADIAYPQNIDLLNRVREKAEKTVDELCEMTGQKKSRMYRKRARKDYLRLSGPALGKPPKNPALSHQAKKQKYQDICDRNVVEGIFGTAKTAYGLACITARLRETTSCAVGVALLLLSLSRSLRTALALFCLLSLLAILPDLRNSA